MGWSHFSLEPCRANEQWVRKFYANLEAINLSNPVMRIWGKVLNFGFEAINEHYELLDANQRVFETKYYALGSLLVSQLCLGREVPWDTIK